jgi:hypothetical protein
MELMKIGDTADMERILDKHTLRKDRRNSLTLKAHRGPIRALW